MYFINKITRNEQAKFQLKLVTLKCAIITPDSFLKFIPYTKIGRFEVVYSKAQLHTWLGYWVGLQ